MRGKLQIEWDLTFNSMYKHICILIKVYFVSISAIHKNSILNQMGVVDGRVFTIPFTESFHLIPYKAFFRMMMTRCCAISKMGVVISWP